MNPALLAALAQGGASLLGNLFGGKGSGGSQGYDVVNFNDPQDAQNRAASEAYMMDVLSGLRAGQTPDWMNRFTDPLQADLLRQNKNQFFGKEGNYGGSVYDIAQSTGAMAGLGGQAAQAPTNKALSDYADRMSGINQYIAGLKNNYMQQASASVPSQLAQVSAQKNQIVPGMGAPAQSGGNPFAAASSAIGAVDWSKMFSSPPSSTGSMMYPIGQYTQQSVVPQSTQSTALNNLFPLTGGGYR